MGRDAPNEETRADLPRHSRKDTAEVTLTPTQAFTAVSIAGGAAAAWVVAPELAGAAAHHSLAAVFLGVSALKIAAIALSGPPPSSPPDVPEAELPAYTVLVPLFRESAMLMSLVAAMARLEYPRDRLQILLLLEEDDEDTRSTAAAIALPHFIHVLVVPPGRPRTKPRACNYGLRHATGDLLTVYDAEDRPHPAQLKEAVARFADARADLVCLQAPLKIDARRGFLRRQFALEYAAQFEVMFPALERLGLPFPLGGTSNHFRTFALRELGGWDPYNVTEDADIGFRLAARGWRCGILRHPTFEDPPADWHAWLPQRTRWVKGHIQTLLVHMRRSGRRPWRCIPGLSVTLALGVSSALVHGPLAAWLLATGLLSALGAAPPESGWMDAGVLLTGWSASSACAWVGARRAGLRLRTPELLLALAYWPLHTVAAVYATYQLLIKPHHWDKTPHEPA